MKFRKLRRLLKGDSPRIGRWLKRHLSRTKAKSPPTDEHRAKLQSALGRLLRETDE